MSSSLAEHERSSIEATKRNSDNRHLRDSCSSRRTEQLQALEPSLAYTDWPVGTLLRHDADHCRAAVDHIEFGRRGAANVDDAPTAIWAAIRDAHHNRLAAAKVGNHHFRAKRQRAMSGCKPRRAPLAVRPPP